MKRESGFGVMGKLGTSLTGPLASPTMTVNLDVCAQSGATGMLRPALQRKHTRYAMLNPKLREVNR